MMNDYAWTTIHAYLRASSERERSTEVATTPPERVRRWPAGSGSG